MLKKLSFLNEQQKKVKYFKGKKKYSKTGK